MIGHVRVRLELPDPEGKPGDFRWRDMDLPAVPQIGDVLEWDDEEYEVKDVMWTPQSKEKDVVVTCQL